MNLTRVLLSSAAVVVMAGAADAADLIVADPVPVAIAPAAHDWSGAYVGVFGGYATGTVDWTGDYSGNGAGVDASGDFTASGWLLGVTAGANMQMDNFVFGVEGDLAWANIEGEGPALDPLDANPSVPSGTVDWLGTLRARAGVAMDNVLLYGTAGFAFGGISSTITNADDPGVDLTAETTATGWTAGVGAEVALDDNVSVKAEYLYTSLSADDLDFGLTDSGELTSTSDYAAHTVRVGVNFAF